MTELARFARSLNSNEMCLLSFKMMSNLSGGWYRLITVRGSVSLVCFLLCSLIFILEIVYFCRRGIISSTLRRMFVYLTFSSMLYTAVLSMYLGYSIAQKHCYYCIIIMLLEENAGLVQLCLTLGVVIKLLYEVIATNLCQNQVKRFLHHHGKAIECSYVFLSFFLPLLITWAPFRMVSDCRPFTFSIWLFIFYVLFGFVSVLSLLCFLIMVAYLVYIYYKVRKGKMHIKLRTVINDYCQLLPFLIISVIVDLIRVLFNLNFLDDVWAIVTPIGAVTFPIGFLILFIRKQRDIPIRNGEYIECNDLHETAPPSTRLSPNSYTDQQERNFLSPINEWTTGSTKAKSSPTFRDAIRNIFNSNKNYGTLNT